MLVYELINELKKYDDDTIVEIDFTYNDSDEGICYDTFNKICFKYSTNSKGYKFLSIRDEDYGE